MNDLTPSVAGLRAMIRAYKRSQSGGRAYLCPIDGPCRAASERALLHKLQRQGWIEDADAIPVLTIAGMDYVQNALGKA